MQCFFMPEVFKPRILRIIKPQQSFSSFVFAAVQIARASDARDPQLLAEEKTINPPCV
jgi:hypothetical protein